MVNNITDGIVQLKEQISDLRRKRAALTSELVLGRANLGTTVSEMIAGFQRDRQEVGEKSNAELAQSRADRESTISEVMTWFQLDRQDMAEQTNAERREFVSKVKESVEALRQNTAKLRAEFSADIMGARAAWSGFVNGRTPIRNRSTKRARKAGTKIKHKIQ